MDLRREWLDMLVAQCQTFIGNVLTLGDTEDLADTASSWVRALPDPSGPVEDLALCAVLMKFAVKWSAAVHEQAHRSSKRCQGEFVTTYGLDQFGGPVGQSAKQSFENWGRLFSEEFRRTHPRSVAQRAARIIRTEAPARLDIAKLAHTVGVSPVHLRRVFQRERGLALPEYLRRVRLLCALDVLVTDGGKIEAIALEVGYRSKKNFYRVFKQLTGLTPTEFRSLPVASARLIVDSTRLALYSRRAS